MSHPLTTAKFSHLATPEILAASDATLEATLAEYKLLRGQLIAQEKALRPDHEFRTTASETARRAHLIVEKIRAHELATIWSKKAGGMNIEHEHTGGGEEEEDEEEVFQGMVFTLAKARMEKTLLWKIVKQVPKGALLHAHLEAMVEVGWLLRQAMEMEGMCVYLRTGASGIKTRKELETVDVGFRFVPLEELKTRVSSGPGLFEEMYISGTQVPLEEAAASFPEHLFPAGTNDGKKWTPREAFLDWIHSRATITPEESLLQHQGITKIWDKFQSIFSVLGGLVFYEPLFRKFVAHLLAELHADGINWVDMRIAFHMQFQEADTGKVVPRHNVVRVYTEEVEKYVASTLDPHHINPFSSKPRTPFRGSRIIWTAARICPRSVIRENMEECIEAKRLHGAAISGYDLVGYENAGRSLLSHLPDLLWFQRTTKAEFGGEGVPFFFHAGETLDDDTCTSRNVYDALLLKTKRIGHGFSLYKHPHLLNICKERDVILEMCPISNEILRLTGSVLQHPLPAVLASGVKVAISNDDPGILGQKVTGGVTHDLWQVLQAFGSVGLLGVGGLCLNGVEGAAYADGEAEAARAKEEKGREWRAQWEEFCAWVVDEFGEWEEREVEGMDEE
ncbi:hypothetical protein DFH27DRAFT_561968 [Peziza echinospora]|nr:hypothetical protein DFH27DRAFT_561968 [Peziza echinospora]